MPVPPAALLDGRADALIGAAAADVAGHRRVDLGVGRMRLLGEERRRLHDLPDLAVAALGDVGRDPRALHRDGSGRRSSPSMLTIERPPTADIGVWHERTALPSTCTVQAPQKPPPQPNLVPVRPSSSRRYQSSGMSGSPSNVRFDPFTVNVAIGASLINALGAPPPSAAARLAPLARRGRRRQSMRLGPSASARPAIHTRYGETSP